MNEERRALMARLASMLLYCDHVSDRLHAEQVIDHVLTAVEREGYRLVRVL